MLPLLTGAGLAAASGLNALIPLALLGVLGRFTAMVELAPGFDWIATWPVILAALVFIAIDLVIDKIPSVDTVNDLFQSPIRPAAGALAFAASSSAEIMGVAPLGHRWLWIAWVLGALIGATAHFSKAACRTAISADTGGSGTPIASFVEDALAVTLSFFAMIAPWLVLPIFAALIVTVYRIVTIGRRRRRRLAERQAALRAEREARAASSGETGWLALSLQRIRARSERANGDDVPARKTRERGGRSEIRESRASRAK